MKYKNKIIFAAFPSIALLANSNVYAYDFNLGEVEGQITSQLSVGTNIATADPDKRFIFTSSGGSGTSRTGDDGRLNFKKGDVFSTVFKGLHDLELKYRDSGLFVRGKYWYDFELKDGHQDFYDIDDAGRKPLQKASGAYLLDAFVYQNYNVKDNPGSVRLGRQVVSWGESVFIPNSINTINPVDVASLRRPGSEVKEALLPVEMLYISQGISDSLGVELFYQLKFRPTSVENCGTFFAVDPTATGCVDRLVINGPDLPQGDPDLANGWLANPALANYSVRTQKDKEARDGGQFGVALRYQAESLNNTEFGFYAINYHSRSPIQSYVAGPGLTGRPGVVGINGVSGPSGYFFEYPEDIRLYGVSFQTNVSDWSLGGELSYRPNMPLQISTADLGRTATAIFGDSTHRNLGNLPVNSYIQGYERKEFWQAQVSAVKFFDQVLGASRMTVIGEVGANYIGGISNKDDTTQFGRDSTFGQSPNAAGRCATQGPPAASPKADSWCTTDGFYSDISWGYRVRTSLDYNNVFAGINLTPSVAFSHDVSGYSVNFTENAKAISVGLTAEYLAKYSVGVNYTDYFDGKFNNLVDRDFLSVNAAVNF